MRWQLCALLSLIYFYLNTKSHKHNLKEDPGEKSFFPISTRSRIIHLLLLLLKKTIIETMEITYRFQRHRHVLNICGGGLVARSCLTLVTPWTVAHQAPLSTGFPRQAYWSGLSFSSSGDLLDPGIDLGLLHCRRIPYHLSHQERGEGGDRG